MAASAADDLAGLGHVMPVASPAVRSALAVAALVVVADQLSKHWAVNALDGGRIIDVVGSLRFNLSFNDGIAFSQGGGLGPLVPILAIGVVAALLIAVGRSTSRWFTVAVGLVIGGALGNVVDRLFRNRAWLRGAVVDFIDLQWWPVFNVADMAIVVGAGILLVATLRSS